VIERNLPQLRSALAEQGLKIDQFQVNIDKGQQGGQFDNQAQQDHDRGFPQHRNWNRNPETEEPMIPLAHLIQNGGEGISLHV
jgi:flagellar hook-length control protein FliK